MTLLLHHKSLPVLSPNLEGVRLPRHHLQLGRARVGRGGVEQRQVPQLFLFTLNFGAVSQEPAPPKEQCHTGTAPPRV